MGGEVELGNWGWVALGVAEALRWEVIGFDGVRVGVIIAVTVG